MLDELIRARANTPPTGARLRIARGVQRVTHLMVMPGLACMLIGLVAFLAGNESGQIPGAPVVPARRIAGAALFTSVGAMSLGLLLLALIPVASVILVLVERLRSRQWGDAAVALGVVAILIASMLLFRE